MALPSRIARSARGGRRDRYEKNDQLFIVALSHAVLVIGVVVIMTLTFRGEADEPVPVTFWLTEIAIIAICLLSLIEWRVAGRVINRYVPRDVVISVLGGFRAEGIGDAVRGVILLAVSFAQFFALGALLHRTGGPIDSPFAQLGLAIAIFTPFIANNWLTMVVVVSSTMVFYVVLVWVDGFADPHDPRPAPGAYIAVNLLILLAATVLTLGELLRFDRLAASTSTELPPRLGDVLADEDDTTTEADF
jgi:hypothetical protein